MQTVPKVYLVYFGWGESGAFPASARCKSEKLQEGSLKATLQCDPEGAGKRIADWVQQLGGTEWANVSTQYYQSGAGGGEEHITNPSNVLGGIWVDNKDAADLAHDLR